MKGQTWARVNVESLYRRRCRIVRSQTLQRHRWTKRWCTYIILVTWYITINVIFVYISNKFCFYKFTSTSNFRASITENCHLFSLSKNMFQKKRKIYFKKRRKKLFLSLIFFSLLLFSQRITYLSYCRNIYFIKVRVTTCPRKNMDNYKMKHI